MQLKFIQVDMTFKRIHGKVNEIVFGYFNDYGQKCEFASLTSIILLIEWLLTV